MDIGLDPTWISYEIPHGSLWGPFGLIIWSRGASYKIDLGPIWILYKLYVALYMNFNVDRT